MTSNDLQDLQWPPVTSDSERQREGKTEPDIIKIQIQIQILPPTLSISDVQTSKITSQQIA